MREQMESLPARGVWIEIARLDSIEKELASLPARGVWIEIDGVRSGRFDD